MPSGPLEPTWWTITEEAAATVSLFQPLTFGKLIPAVFAIGLAWLITDLNWLNCASCSIAILPTYNATIKRFLSPADNLLTSYGSGLPYCWAGACFGAGW